MTENPHGEADRRRSQGAGAPLSISDRELIDRYLAERLTEEESGSIEARIVADTGFRHEVEVTEALRAGLRRLDRADGVEALLSGPGPRNVSDRAAAFWARPSYALAASVATLGLGVLSLVLYGQLKHERALADESRSVQIASQLAPTQRRTTVAFASLRSGSEPVTIHLPSEPVQYEMAFDVGAEPAAAYAVKIIKAATDGDIALFEAPYIAPHADGLIRLSVHSGLLAPGEYEVQLASQTSDAIARSEPNQATVSFRLRIVR